MNPHFNPIWVLIPVGYTQPMTCTYQNRILVYRCRFWQVQAWVALKNPRVAHDIPYIDLITNLPTVNGYDSIFVMVNQGFSKGVILPPCAKTITWDGITKLLQDNLFKRFGLPDQMISDCNPWFAARAFQELSKLLNITLSLSTAYYPQTDGATEQVNQEIEAYLSIYCTAHPEDWPNTLTTWEFTQNNRRHADRTHT